MDSKIYWQLCPTGIKYYEKNYVLYKWIMQVSPIDNSGRRLELHTINVVNYYEKEDAAIHSHLATIFVITIYPSFNWHAFKSPMTSADIKHLWTNCQLAWIYRSNCNCSTNLIPQTDIGPPSASLPCHWHNPYRYTTIHAYSNAPFGNPSNWLPICCFSPSLHVRCSWYHINIATQSPFHFMFANRYLEPHHSPWQTRMNRRILLLKCRQ